MTVEPSARYPEDTGDVPIWAHSFLERISSMDPGLRWLIMIPFRMGSLGKQEPSPLRPESVLWTVF